VVVAVVAAPTLVGKLARGRIESAAREALEAEVAIGDLSLGWLSGLELKDLVVQPKEPGKPGFSIGSITAKPQLSSLARGRFEVPDLVVKHVTLEITKPAKPETEEEEEPEEPETGIDEPVPAFSIGATIEDVTIVYRRAEWERPIRIEHVGPLTIAAASDQPTRVELSCGPSVRARVEAVWTKDGKKLRKRDHVATGEVTFDRADLRTFVGALGPWLDDLQGVADGKIAFEARGKAIQTTGNLGLTQVAASPRGRPGPHRLRDFTLKHDLKSDDAGSWTGLVEAGASQADLAALSELGEALRIDRFDLRARLSGNIRADIERLAVQADFGGVEASGQVAAGKEPMAATVNVEARAGIDKLGRWLGGMPDVTGNLVSKARIVVAGEGAIEVRGATSLAGFAAKDVPGVGALREKDIVIKHDCDWGGDVIRMRDVSVSSSFLQAKCTGALEPKAGGGSPEGRVDVGISADLDVIAGLFGEHLPVKPGGKLTVTGKLAESEAGSSFDLLVKGDRVGLAGGSLLQPLDLGNVQGSFVGRLSGDRSAASMEKWSLTSRVATLGGSFEALRLGEKHGPMKATVAGTIQPDLILPSVTATKLKAPVGRVDLAAEATATDSAWVVKVSKLEGAGVTAAIDATYPHADVPGGAATFDAQLRGALERIAPLVADPPRDGRRPLSGQATARLAGSFSPATRSWEVRELTASGPGLALKGNAKAGADGRTELAVEADVTMAEAGPILQCVSPSIQGSGKAYLKAAGQLAMAEGSKPEHSRGVVVLKVDRLKTEMLDLQNLDVAGQLDGGVAKTTKATAGLNGGTAMLDASVDLRPEPPQWRANTKVDRVQITKEMQPAIARAVPIFSGIGVTVKGMVGCDVDVIGRGQTWEEAKPTLTGNGVVSLAGARVSQSEILAVIGQFIGLPPELLFDDFQSRFRVENGAVRQDRLVMTSQKLDLVMSGTTSFEGRLDYVVGAKPKGGISSTWQKIRPILDREGFLAMRLQGDIRKPSLKPPKVEHLLGGAVEDLLKGGIEDLFKKKKKPN
jgi:hypothetical protein